MTSARGPGFTPRLQNQTRNFVGPIVGVTPTHIEQQVSPSRIVRHERSKFQPDPANGVWRDALKPGLAAPVAIVSYDRGQATIRAVRLDAEVRGRLQQQTHQWIDQAVRDPALRERFKASASRAVEEIGAGRGVEDSRSFARHLAHESAHGSARESPLDRILQRHEMAATATREAERSSKSQPIGAAGTRLWASLDAADMARLFSERTSEQDRQRALAAVRRAPEEYQQAFARSLREHEQGVQRPAFGGPQRWGPGGQIQQRDRERDR